MIDCIFYNGAPSDTIVISKKYLDHIPEYEVLDQTDCAISYRTFTSDYYKTIDDIPDDFAIIRHPMMPVFMDYISDHTIITIVRGTWFHRSRSSSR